MRTTNCSNRLGFYDLDQIKQIPIVDVCENMLGIHCERKNGAVWCKTHNEKTASTRIHVDKNFFYNFGTHDHGDVIQLVSTVLRVSRRDAINLLAQRYDIPAIDQRNGLNRNELTLWEYSKIGLAGDLATKNFEFDVDRLPIERIMEISEKYSMSMNSLRKKHPKTYEKVLRQRAIPFVKSLRNDYYIELWSRYNMMCNIGNPSLFFRPDHLDVFSNQIKELKQAEQILSRAVHGTEITWQPTREYDPAKDMEMLSKGEVKPIMGPLSYNEMQSAAKTNNCEVKYWPVPYEKYALHMMGESEHLPYSAFLSAGRVVIGYMSKDYGLFKPFFDRMRSNQSREGERKPKEPESQVKSAAAPPKKRSAPER